MSIYSNFVKDLKEKDSCRVGSFEASLSKISDEMAEEKCGGRSLCNSTGYSQTSGDDDDEGSPRPDSMSNDGLEI